MGCGILYRMVAEQIGLSATLATRRTVPNAFVQTVVSDEDAEHRVMVRIRGPLVDILVSMAPDVMAPMFLSPRLARRF